MKKPFNIMHLVLNLDVGGLEWVVVNLLKRLDRDKFRPFVACLLNGGILVDEVKHLGVEIDILNKPDKLDFSVSFKLAKILKDKSIDLIHTHNTGAYLYGGIAAKLSGISAIIHTEHGRFFPDKKRLMFTEKILSTFTHRIVAVSEDLKNKLVEFEKINPDKIEVIPNGIDMDLFKPMDEQLIRQKKAELGLGKDDFIIGNVGRLVEVKDHKNLIEAFNLVNKERPQAKLLIVGDGPLKECLKLTIKSLKLKDNVMFLGERNDVPALLNVFDVFVLPSKSEGVSLTLLEAMATKRPIVATDVGGSKEIIENGRDGYLVPPNSYTQLAEAILNVIKNPKKAQMLGLFAYKKTKKRYNLDRMTYDYQSIYESALMRNRN